ncbi:MAG: heavy metal transporter [Catenulispora sp. 13_1_20CM_3_70_7]|jgi:copper chaperone|nr:heavy-metal-associated domain-containing protein [Catenulisporales bacterium]OLE26419.1 MAG: heavy metal transporter [Catenulispora sp. 13_1_20CM_3_70_7]
MSTATVTAAADSPATAVYGVAGMSCGHCSAAVTEALSVLPGVTEVEIDLPGRRALVTSAAPLETAAVRDAVEGAGYQLI